MYQRIEDGIYYSSKFGRIVEHKGRSTKIFWNKTMLDDLRRYFPVMLNEELAGTLGVSVRTMIRKARELGIEKNQEWLRKIWEERRNIAHVIAKKKGHPGCFKKGMRFNPGREYQKGHKLTNEQEAKRRRSLSAYYRANPSKARAKNLKAWETRRNNTQLQTV